MPRVSPYRIELTREEREALEARGGRYTSPYRDVVRAKLVLLAAQGLSNDVIAARLDLPRQVVSKWRKRFWRNCLEGGGRPAFPPRVVVAVKALACELPAQRGVPLARWALTDLRQAVVAQGLVAQISGTTLWRWLSQDALRPWRHRSWIFPRDPAFAAKAERILELYAGRWAGVPLGPREYVVSADEKTSIQARLRIHPRSPPPRGVRCTSNTNTSEAEPG